MKQLEALIHKLRKHAAQNNKLMTTIEYFKDNWINRAAISELVVPEHLICPLTPKMSDDPAMLENGEFYDRSAILRELDADWISYELIASKSLQVPDLHDFGEVKPCICSDPDDPDSDGRDPDPCRSRRCYRL